MKRKDKDAEALWAEVKRLTLETGRLQQQYDEQTACVIVHRGSALACSDAMRAAYYDERRRAERLAEALRGWWKTRRPVGWTEDQHRSCPHVNLATDAEKALATALLRDQEEGSRYWWPELPKNGGPDWTGFDG